MLTLFQVVFDPYRVFRPVVADIVFYIGCICCMTVVEPYLPDRVLRQFGLVQFVPGPPLAQLRGSRGSTAATYSVVYQYTDALWQNWRDDFLHEVKRVPVRSGVPWESHHVTQSRRGAVHYECGGAECSGFGSLRRFFGWRNSFNGPV
ncbi:hypothetical protein RHMOL_Rhmol01G0181200 [Rhododendron molle]|uniref:Uncharacterized protein n=1 Tax=Rhododendron molle TaxID=49168 RepID=A0ACC0Q4B9_RHOML|nr:hypothetical protein RHMOL_Rhmol01G0181200 [Rhododendron molle]